MQLKIFPSLTLCFVVLAGWQITLAQTPAIGATVYRDRVRFESQG